MKNFLPQFRLQTFFLIFFCAAVGMTCATAPEAKGNPKTFFLLYVPQLNWHYAFMGAAATAIVLGLIQQIRMLLRQKDGPNPDNKQFAFARIFAIGWRIIIALIMGLCLMARILISRKIIRLPEHADAYFHQVFPDNLLCISVIIVLIDSIRRRESNRDKSRRLWIDVLSVISGFTLALLVLPQSTYVSYLVHLATEGIENAQPFKLQRTGTFPDVQNEHFRTFWLSQLAVASIVLAATFLFLARRMEMTTRRVMALAVAYLVLLATSTAYCIWFYTSEFERLSPDMASVGFASIWFDWLSSGILIAIVISACAYRLSVRMNSADTRWLDVGPSHQSAPHESALCLLVLFAASLIYLEETFRQYWDLLFLTFWVKLFYVLWEPEFYVMLALTILSLQLCWIRWKRRRELLTWQLHAVDRRRFICNWLALALLSIVALPTMAIYCFTFWLGPWYLYGS